jgi:hypothetical protein
VCSVALDSSADVPPHCATGMIDKGGNAGSLVVAHPAKSAEAHHTIAQRATRLRFNIVSITRSICRIACVRLILSRLLSSQCASGGLQIEG